MTLDEAVRKAVAEDRLGFLTVVYAPVQGQWQGNHRAANAEGFRVEYRDDPVSALIAALGYEPIIGQGTMTNDATGESFKVKDVIFTPDEEDLVG